MRCVCLAIQNDCSLPPSPYLLYTYYFLPLPPSFSALPKPVHYVHILKILLAAGVASRKKRRAAKKKYQHVAPATVPAAASPYASLAASIPALPSCLHCSPPTCQPSKKVSKIFASFHFKCCQSKKLKKTKEFLISFFFVFGSPLL